MTGTEEIIIKSAVHDTRTMESSAEKTIRTHNEMPDAQLWNPSDFAVILVEIVFRQKLAKILVYLHTNFMAYEYLPIM